MKSVSIGRVVVGSGPLFVIAGPDVIEGEAFMLEVAAALRDVTQALGIPFVFKSSFDKANRTAFDAFRGPGLVEGLRILRRVREKVGVPVTSDVHSIEQVAPAAEVLDLLQLPAFLSRQTDLLAAAARTGRPVNWKKGQFLAPWDVAAAVRKLESAGAKGILVTERGSTFGYNRLVVDFAGFPTLRETGWPLVFDATHSVQQPGGLGSASGGASALVPTMASAAVAAGCDGIFFEVHPTPEIAPCDGPCMVKLADFEALLRRLLAIRAVRGT
ncbi:MAG: 3-deoxy-8-phosphooctulonate synthase [Planctomycetes bacterium]|nr:3-deoxy-8-phosphooctulonate synthase [Planctomycetota bacterium]MBI3847467.1 3-deoxy-8-phosphooctulonate synthase [Planctomycetota bacterium]